MEASLQALKEFWDPDPKEPMLCPCCNQTLKPLDVKRYETLMEHGFNPNGTPFPKTGYGCVNPNCIAENVSIRWLSNGEGPFGLGSSDVPREAYIDGHRTPPNTWQGRYDREER